MNKPTKKELKKYNKYMDGEAKKFKVTSEDLHNFVDLFYMITPEIDSTLKLNKMDNWFNKFFSKIEKIVVPELDGKSKKGFGRSYGY